MDLASAAQSGHTLTTSFAMRALRGFGLMQRDRNFSSYEDSEARYELRPSAWIEPMGSWGPGRVELMQLSTPDETNDNIVAYWVPEPLPAMGQPLDFAYRLHWQGTQQMQRPPGALGSADAASAVALPSWPRTNNSSSSISPVHRSPRCRPMRT